jgi:hypothetical protein
MGDAQPKTDVLLSSFLWPDATVATGGAYVLGGIPSMICGDDDRGNVLKTDTPAR